MSTQPARAIPPDKGPLLGIDYGTVRIGLALSDREQQLASPLIIYHRQAAEQEARYFLRLVEQERLVGFVLGLPTHTNGRETGKSGEVRRFAAWLHNLSGLPFGFADERYTSIEADDLLRQQGLKASERKRQLDKLAAQLILTAYLEDRRAGRHTADNDGAASAESPL